MLRPGNNLLLSKNIPASNHYLIVWCLGMINTCQGARVATVKNLVLLI